MKPGPMATIPSPVEIQERDTLKTIDQIKLLPLQEPLRMVGKAQNLKKRESLYHRYPMKDQRIPDPTSTTPPVRKEVYLMSLD
jgi:hypothetical protein